MPPKNSSQPESRSAPENSSQPENSPVPESSPASEKEPSATSLELRFGRVLDGARDVCANALPLCFSDESGIFIMDTGELPYSSDEVLSLDFSSGVAETLARREGLIAESLLLGGRYVCSFGKGSETGVVYETEPGILSDKAEAYVCLAVTDLGSGETSFADVGNERELAGIMTGFWGEITVLPNDRTFAVGMSYGQVERAVSVFDINTLSRRDIVTASFDPNTRSGREFLPHTLGDKLWLLAREKTDGSAGASWRVESFDLDGNAHGVSLISSGDYRLGYPREFAVTADGDWLIVSDWSNAAFFELRDGEYHLVRRLYESTTRDGYPVSILSPRCCGCENASDRPRLVYLLGARSRLSADNPTVLHIFDPASGELYSVPLPNGRLTTTAISCGGDVLVTTAPNVEYKTPLDGVYFLSHESIAEAITAAR